MSRFLPDTKAPDEVTSLGQGFKTLLGGVAGDRTVSHQDIAHSTNQNITGVKYHVCKTAAEVHSKTSLEVGVNVSVGPWGLKNKTDFVNEITRHSNSFSILMVVNAARTERYADRVTLDSSTLSGADFYHKFGDSYVRELTRGAQYIAAYTFVCESEAKMQELSDKASASYGRSGASASVGFSASQSEYTKNSNTQCFFSELCIGGTTGPNSNEDLDKYAQRIQQLNIEDTSPVINFKTQKYTELVINPNDFETIDKNCDHFRQWYLERLVKANAHLQRMEKVTRLYEFYWMSHLLGSVRERQSKVSAIVKKLNAWVNTVENDPATDHVNDHLDCDWQQLDQIPKPNFWIVDGQQNGAQDTGVTWFRDVSAHQVSLGVHMKSINVRYPERTKFDEVNTWKGPQAVWVRWDGFTQIRTTYGFMEAGNGDFQCNRGGDGDILNDATKLQLGPGVWIRKMSVGSDKGGWGGNFACRLTLAFENDKIPEHTFGGSSKFNSDPFSGPGNSRVVGWAGRHGGLVDRIGPLYAQFGDPVWIVPESKLHAPVATNGS